MSLRTRFSLYCAIVLFAFSVLLTMLVAASAFYDSKVSSQEAAFAKAEGASFEVRKIFSEAISKVGEAKTRWELTRPSRDSVEKDLVDLFQNDKRFLGAGAVFEPNLFDGRDVSFIGRKGSNSKGRFVPYFHRSIKNPDEISLEESVYYDNTDESGNYYQIPKATLSDFVGEPYFYPLEGVNIFMISLIRPISRHGRFIGIVGLDLKLSDLEEELFSKRPFGDGHLALISPGGKYAVHGAKGILQGKNAGTPEVKESIQKSLASGQPFAYPVEGGNSYIFPFSMGTYGKNWAIEVYVPDSVLWNDLGPIILRCLLITFALLPVCLYFLDRFFCKYVSEGLSEATTFADSLGAGNYSAQIPTRKFQDEIHHLFITLENMKEKLLAAIDQQIRSEKILRESAEIYSRNEIIRLQKEELEVTLGELKTAQETLLRNERLAAIGRISGAVSHQINNPLGAIGASRENISFYVKRITILLPFLFEYLSDADESEREFFNITLKRTLENDKEQIGKKFRETRHSIEAFLRQEQIEDAGDKAAVVAELGFANCPEFILQLCRCSEWERISEFLMAVRGLEISEEVIHRSTDRMYKIVSALETYSGTAKEDKERWVKVSDTMEVVLGVYEGAGGNRVTVERNYISEATMRCIPEDLVRLWTQIVDNAYQAMSGEGKLKVSIYDAESKIICEVEDSGSGIPKNIREQVGEVLSSGKSEGVGAGIGLAVAASISKKYGGSWNWESEPGCTIFRFSFPKSE
ncbi:histidine kinase [Leptospira selangorensis]|uniref:histidine kinase n=1 Tax=Leptospira selangorensis TaxID=2484982 RepID=A0A4R9G333_9LEPT|nr:ATP-binding protein [Leptospira selangorensis]TGK05754.1 histidine kinase [Leptospira selangorensis]TGM12446.1 histidine kinase [Leptospira selangorensis]TGM14509.1 histidine kinase [Leptospira selangorensis]